MRFLVQGYQLVQQPEVTGTVQLGLLFFCFCFFFGFSIFLLGPHPWLMDVTGPQPQQHEIRAASVTYPQLAAKPDP